MSVLDFFRPAREGAAAPRDDETRGERAEALNERLLRRIERLEAFIAESGQTAAFAAWSAARRV